MMLTTEKIDVSSAKSLELESNPLGKLFMYSKKICWTKIDACFDGRPLGRPTIEDYSLVPVSEK